MSLAVLYLGLSFCKKSVNFIVAQSGGEAIPCGVALLNPFNPGRIFNEVWHPMNLLMLPILVFQHLKRYWRIAIKIYLNQIAFTFDSGKDTGLSVHPATGQVCGAYVPIERHNHAKNPEGHSPVFPLRAGAAGASKRRNESQR